jgi:hypothetical protein
MEGSTNVLQCYLTERLSLSKERKTLVLEQHEIIDAKAYLNCIERLDTVRARLKLIEREIQRLTVELGNSKSIKCYNNGLCVEPAVNASNELFHIFILIIFFLMMSSQFPWKNLYSQYF